MSITQHHEPAASRYEFRVWNRFGESGPRLAPLGDRERVECVEDHYLLLGRRGCNAKIRGNRLKVKLLVEERAGFQRWSVLSWPLEPLEPAEPVDSPIERVYGPFDALTVGLSAGQLPAGITTVTVIKRRRQFRVGSIRVEISDVAISGRPGRCTTVAIEGTELADLIAFRQELGLDHRPNVGYHLAIDPAEGILDSLVAG